MVVANASTGILSTLWLRATLIFAGALLNGILCRTAGPCKKRQKTVDKKTTTGKLLLECQNISCWIDGCELPVLWLSGYLQTRLMGFLPDYIYIIYFCINIIIIMLVLLLILILLFFVLLL
jgi:hypothetical protein